MTGTKPAEKKSDGKMKRVILGFVIAIGIYVIIVCRFLGVFSLNQNLPDRYDYKLGISALEKGDYESAFIHFSYCDPSYSEYVPILQKYADVRHKMQHSSDASLRQHSFFDLYKESEYQGPFAKEMKAFIDSVNQRAEMERISRERQKQREEEERERKAMEAAKEKERIESIPSSLPYKGLEEKYIDSTILGPSHERKVSYTRSGLGTTEWHTYYWYDYWRKPYFIVTATKDKVFSVSQYANSPYYKGAKEHSSSSSGKQTDYNDFDTFYDDHYDDFYDYDEAEEYFYDHY